MKQIYNDAKDEHVAARIVYVGSDDKLYTDATTQTSATEVPETELFDLFIKGVVAVKDSVYYKALSYDAVNGINFGIAEATE